MQAAWKDTQLEAALSRVVLVHGKKRQPSYGNHVRGETPPGSGRSRYRQPMTPCKLRSQYQAWPCITQHEPAELVCTTYSLTRFLPGF